MADGQQQLDPGATNPDARPNVDPSADPNQVIPAGNPVPQAAPAKDPKPEGEKKPDPKPENKPEPKPEGEKKEDPPDPNAEDDKALNSEVWGSTGDETGDAVLQLLQNSGVTPDEAKALLFDGVKSGDLTKIDRAALEKKVGKVKAQLIVSGVTSFVTSQKSAAQAIVTTLHEEVGGKENWDAVAKWANAAIDADTLEQYKGMINAGGVQAKLAARAMKEAYEGDSKNSTLNAKKEVVPKNGAPTTTITPMSKIEYVKALEKLNTTHNGRPPEHLRRALLEGRKAGQKLGR